MDFTIRPILEDDIEAVVDLSLAAWAPVFRSFETVLGQKVYDHLFPDWHSSQSAAVEQVCKDNEKYTTYVAEVDGKVVGFIAYFMNQEENSGEVEMLAVHPDYQNRGIGTKLNEFVIDQMRAAGVKLVAIGTGGDPGHAPARRCYEKAGYTGFPQVRYYKYLGD